MSDLLLVTARYPYGDGEAFLESELRELLRRGHRVRVAPLRRVGARRAGTADIETVEPRLNDAFPAGTRGTMTRFGPLKGRPKFHMLACHWWSTALYGATRDDPPDSVHGYWATAPAAVAWRVAQLMDRPWSFTAHRYDIMEDLDLRRKLAACSAARFISLDGRALAVARTGLVPDERWVVAPLGIDIPEPRGDARDAETPTLLWVGTLAAVKGPEIALRAFSMVRASHPTARLVMVGDGPLRADLRQLADELHVAAYTSFLGVVDHESLLSMFDAANITALVSSSYYEGIPVVLMEAMARMVPVVATRTGGVPELVRPPEGILCDPGDATSLADGLDRVLRLDAGERREMGKAGRLRVCEGHDATRTTSHFEARFLTFGS